MIQYRTPSDWDQCVDQLAEALHARNRWRLSLLTMGFVSATGRRTVGRSLRVVGISGDFTDETLTCRAQMDAAVYSIMAQRAREYSRGLQTFIEATGETVVMARCLVDQELGAGLGHVTLLRPVVEALLDQGHQVFTAIQDIAKAVKTFRGLPVAYLQASSRNGFYLGKIQ